MKRIGLGLALFLAACATTHEEPKLTATPVSFASLEGWETDPVAETLPVLRRSCQKWLASGRATIDFLPGLDGTSGAGMGEASIGDLEVICIEAASLAAHNVSDDEARAFYLRHFQPVRVQLGDDGEALFTGYFEPTYRARTTPAPGMVPILTRPDDLVTVNLGTFLPELKGKRVAGKVSGGQLIPYETHEEIVATPPETTRPLGYMDPTDLLFLQIQGSGRLVFDNGETVRVGYAAQNGHQYVAVGRTLVEDGALPLEEVTMQSIRDWLYAAPPEDAARVRFSNPSYVFFTRLDDLERPDLGPLGAQGTQLTPERSLAVDDEIYGYGLPVWVEMTGDAPLTRLFIAQDTGGAIRGAQRADLFLGSSEEAADRAGKLKSPGHMIILLPKALNGETDDAA